MEDTIYYIELNNEEQRTALVNKGKVVLSLELTI